MSSTIVMDGQEFGYEGGVDFGSEQDTLIDIVSETVVRAREKLIDVVGLYAGVNDLLDQAGPETQLRLFGLFPNLRKLGSFEALLPGELAPQAVAVVA